MNKLINRELENNLLSIYLSGCLIYGKTESFQDHLNLIKDEYDGYIINLSDIEKIDSTGFGTLINFGLKMDGKHIVLVLNNPLINRLIHVAKLHLIFSVTDTEAEAITLIKSGDKPEYLISKKF